MSSSASTSLEKDLAEVYKKHGRVVLRRARAILGSDADAEEILQEVFMSLLQRPDQFEGRSSITTFLYSVTTHACLNRIRKRSNRARLLEEKVKPETEHAAAPRAHSIALLRELLPRIPDDVSEVAIHYFVDQMSQQEIAETLGVSRRAVRTHLARFEELAQRHREEIEGETK